MRWTELLQVKLPLEQATTIFGVCTRTFRRQINRFNESGFDGLLDKRLTQISSPIAPVDEVISVVNRYKSRHQSWDAAHFFSWYKSDGGRRSCTWVKNKLQSKGLVSKASKKGSHRKRREPSPMPGMMLH